MASGEYIPAPKGHAGCCGKRTSGGDCVSNVNPFVGSGKPPWWTVEAESVDVAKCARREDADTFADLLRARGRVGVRVR